MQGAVKIERILREVGDHEEPAGHAGATAAADSARLRGIPAVGVGCSGAIRGTNPVAALLGRESRRR